MLILEIAAGIVLAVVVLRFWPFVLAGAAVVAAVVALGLYLAPADDASRAAKLARDREQQWASIRDATPREMACALGRSEAWVTPIYKKSGPVKATVLNPECVLDGPVVPPAPTSPAPTPPAPSPFLVGVFLVLAVIGMIWPQRISVVGRYAGRYAGRLIDWIVSKVGSAKANRETR